MLKWSILNLKRKKLATLIQSNHLMVRRKLLRQVILTQFFGLTFNSTKLLRQRLNPVSQAALHCRVNCREISELGVVEGVHRKVQLANSLNRLNDRREFLMQCINPFTEPVELFGLLVSPYSWCCSYCR